MVTFFVVSGHVGADGSKRRLVFVRSDCSSISIPYRVLYTIGSAGCWVMISVAYGFLLTVIPSGKSLCNFLLCNGKYPPHQSHGFLLTYFIVIVL